MRNVIDLTIRILMRIVIFLAVLFIGFFISFMIISQKNNIAIEDTVSYLKSFVDTPSAVPSIQHEVINVTLEDADEKIQTPSVIHAASNSFYYQQLKDDAAQSIYQALEKNIDRLKKENEVIDFSTQFNSLLHEANGQDRLNRSFQSALDAFSYDHPELFYIDITKICLIIQYTSIGTKTTYHVSLAPQNNKNYLYDQFSSETQVEKAVSTVENIRKNLLQNIAATMSDYEKALMVHDILVNSLEYDSSTTRANSYNIYGALAENIAVCEGYAKAFKYILDALDIECILVSGTATNSSGSTESHMWNYIQLGGKWYGVDVTWDDPVIIGGFTKNIIRHNYFCKGSNVFQQSHRVSPQISDEGMAFSVPNLSSTNYQ